VLGDSLKRGIQTKFLTARPPFLKKLSKVLWAIFGSIVPLLWAFLPCWVFMLCCVLANF
jgi:hypothetical protein